MNGSQVALTIIVFFLAMTAVWTWASMVTLGDIRQAVEILVATPTVQP